MASLVPTWLGPFFLAQISIFRWISIKTNNNALEKMTKFKVAITILIVTITVYVITVVSIRLSTKSSLGVIEQVS